MNSTSSSDNDKTHVIRLNLIQIRFVDEFVGDRHLKKPGAEGRMLVMYANVKQNPPLWNPLLHKGKLINLSGAEICLFQTDEDRPYTDLDFPDKLSFKKENFLIEVPNRIYGTIAEEIRQKNILEVELLLHASIASNSDYGESREVLRLEFGKIWLRSGVPLAGKKSAFWKILALFLLSALLLRHI